MRMGVIAFGIAFLAAGAAKASSFVTVEEPGPAALPSIIEVATPTGASAVSEQVAVSSESKLELAALDPLNMLPAGGNSVVRVEPLTPSVMAVIVPDPDISNEVVAAIDQRSKPRQSPLPMVMRGGIVGDPFMAAIELGKALDKLPGKAESQKQAETQVPTDPAALDKPQFTETGARMPANGEAGGRARPSAFKPSRRAAQQ